MRSVLEAGFIFWGLFLVFGLIVAGYLLWMYLAERHEDDPDPTPRTGVP